MKKIFVYGDPGILRNYKEVLDYCGASPVFSENLSHAHDCGGLLLPGGGDIDPVLYGEPMGASFNIDRCRDEAEIELIRAFSVTRRPILGICKGIQILNVAFGGSIIQQLGTAEEHRWDGKTGDQVHTVDASPESFLYELYGESFSVNSAHHQGIGRIAQGLFPAALAKDGVIEALENRDKKLYAVQFHPERMCLSRLREDTVDGLPIFDFFLNLC